MQTEVEMFEVLLNGRWSLYLPEHRAKRLEWETGWEKERLDSMCKNVGPGDIVFDIGAEEMDITGLIATWIGQGDGGVVPFEPPGPVWANGLAIWEANPLKQPLAFVAGFAGDTNRHLDKLDFENWPEGALGPVIGDHGFSQLNERPDMPAITITDFVAMTGIHPTVLTIDVEGSELSVLEGASDILTEDLPIVYVSVHPEFMKEQYGRFAQELYDFLGELGYRTKVLAVDHEIHVAAWSPHGRELRF